MGMGAFVTKIGKKALKHEENKFMRDLGAGKSSGGGGSAKAALDDAPSVVNKIQIKRGSKNSGSKY